MIESVQIRHFRGLREIQVSLRPLTFLVGANDTGKSSFLEAIAGRMAHQEPTKKDYWRHETVPEIDILQADGSTFEGKVELFRLPSVGIPMESQGVSDEPGGRAPQLQETGENLAAFLDSLLRKDRKRFDQITHALRKLVPGLDEIRIATPTAETRRINAAIDQGLEIDGDQLSTGVRVIFLFVALAHHPNPPDVLLIEEPENGVHPKRLGEIVSLLRGMAEGEYLGRPTQVIVATHSPYLLDHVKLPQDQVLVFRREKGGDRVATEANEASLRSFLDEFLLGEVWFNRGEEGLLASVQ